jgi:hypothetical protein
VRVPKDAKIEVELEHDRKAFGGFTGERRGERQEGGVTQSN